MTTIEPGVEIRDLDFRDEALPERFHETMQAAREHCPVMRSKARGGYWLVTRYNDVKRVLTDHETFSSARGIGDIPPVDRVPLAPIEVDPPLHRDFRNLLNPFFSRNGVARHEDSIRRIARETIDQWIDRGQCDFSHDFSSAFTSAAVSTVIYDLDLDDPASRELIDRAIVLVDRIRDGDVSAWPPLTEMAASLLQDRRDSGELRDDIINALLYGKLGDRDLAEEERVGAMMVLLTGGLDTTRAAIANIGFRMTQDPDLEQRLTDPDWAFGPLDEFLRLDAPVTGLARYVTRPTHLGGHDLAEGDWVWIMYSSANRDTEIYDHPDELDFHRPRNPHLGFGAGVHHCIGSNLARLQIRIAFDELLNRTQGIRLANPSEPIRFTGGTSREPVSLPITFRPR